MKPILTFLSVLLISIPSFAQRTSDIKNSKDYPLVSRFEGSIIEYYKTTKWDKYPLPASLNNDLWHWEDPMMLEGKIIRTQYSVDPENNPAYILMNFAKAFKNAGYHIIMQRTGDSEDCSWHTLKYDYYENNYNLNLQKFGFAYSANGDQNAIIMAKTNQNGKDIYMVEVIASFSNVTLITQDIIEVEAADTGMVTAKKMAEDIATAGHIAIYDIHFDTGEANISPTSESALQHIAEYLNANPNHHYFIVGHTDNSGDYESNLTLSKNRATSVLEYLITRFNVDSRQLKALGASSMAPISSNNTAEGKAKNRRVEIVEQ